MDCRSPFSKRVNTIEGIVKKVNCAAPVSPNADDDPGSAYQMSFDFMSSLFPEDDYPSVSVEQSIYDVVSSSGS